MGLITYLKLTSALPLKLEEKDWPPEKDLQPWGLREEDQKPIYAAKNVPLPKVGTPYSFYDSNDNYRPMVRFEAALAAYVLTDFSCVMPALQLINQSILRFLEPQLNTPERKAKFGSRLCDALYMDWFGRIDIRSQAPEDMTKVADIVLDVLKQPGRFTLQQIMNVYQSLVHKSSCSSSTFGFGTEDKQRESYKRGKSVFKEVTKSRPREPRSMPDKTPKQVIGYIPMEDTQIAITEGHPRATDEHQRKEGSKDPQSSQTGTRLPFVAAASGSTAQLLRIAKTFAPLDGELLKQFVLACGAFLIGGGHHSFHEVLVVARAGGLAYTDGQYDAVLPDSFKQTGWYDCLADDFADVLYCEYFPELDQHARF